MKTKCCSQCKDEKNIGEFHKNSSNKDGWANWCKSCASAYKKFHNRTLLGRTRNKIRVRKYRNSQKGKATLRQYNNLEEIKIKKRQDNSRYRKQNPEKIIARMRVSHAVRKGLLPKASALECVQCGEQARDYHHHKGYKAKFWLDVIPVCKKCHWAFDRLKIVLPGA